ncbi:NmrA family NAD(P)-binding protein [Promicromonospora thailandica]|uniref:NAD(P)H dehydrogenase (Quinone) n=1 Tax=Promicromonospora thailandica TaxID=765201 RepID=A0A9X2G905_9MICO|nr:NmrA family NAD(P)-binding protein [Promicromonospora thailandica]MCP2265389.1 NAD(P)H dehydrogenase (quinone) [Promicromonospora thailandica]BFF16927.1 SDR family oxidoreductase [Promicromonospora thailandica]
MRIAVTGSTGTLGSQVVRLLAAEDTHQVVALARRPEAVATAVPTAVPTAASAVVVRYADYEDPGSLRAALAGVEVLVFVSSDGEAARMMVHHQNVVRAVVDAGVGHVVYLSGVDADVSSPFCYAFTNGWTERLLEDSGCGFSFARAGLFAEFFGAFLRPALGSGELRVPAGRGRVSLVSRADVGRCLAALAVAGPSGTHHDLTGPVALDLDAVAAVLAEVAGRPVRYTDVPPPALARELAGAGEDPWWTYAYASMFASVREDRWGVVSGEVLRLTGREPRTLGDVLRQDVA